MEIVALAAPMVAKEKPPLVSLPGYEPGPMALAPREVRRGRHIHKARLDKAPGPTYLHGSDTLQGKQIDRRNLPRFDRPGCR